jgi:hypothetical protein
MKSSKLLKKISIFLSLSLINLIPIFCKPAAAGEIRRFEKNGISLNANSAFGFKHGQIIASQYKTANNDLEQMFETINLGKDNYLIRNLALNKCLNSYRTIVNSSPNYFPCNSNDSDQFMKIQGNDIYHSASGLVLNLGEQNNSVVKWKSALLPFNQNTVVNKDVLKKPLVWILGAGSYLVPKILENEIYSTVRYCVLESSPTTCIEVINQNMSQHTTAVNKMGQQIYDRRQIQNKVIFEGIFGNKAGKYFVVPNEIPMEWNTASDLCGKTGGSLRWDNNLKTCFK